MALLNDLTSSDEIRATLGVSDEELPDVTLALPTFVRSLTLDLEDLTPAGDTLSQYLSIWALPAGSRSAVQQRYFDVVQLYSTFHVSKQLLASAPLFAPQRISDGRAELARFADPFADTKAGVLEGFYLARRRLLAAYENLTSTVVTTAITAPVLAVSTGLAVDPVTGA